MAIVSKRKSPHGQSANSGFYAERFRLHVHCLIKEGYACLVPSDYRDSEETDITGELVSRMRGVLEQIGAPRWMQHYSIHEEKPLSGGGARLGKRRKRVDIEFERVEAGRRPRFGLEAKRLCKTVTEADYCGAEGLGCFVSGDYAWGEDKAGMLGYVQTHDEDTWACRIEGKLIRDAGSCGLVPILLT